MLVQKRKHLKANRVSSYLNTGAMNTRTQRMIAQTSSMEIVTTRSEAEALLLEANLVRKFSPRYNVLLKDDKSFPCVFSSRAIMHFRAWENIAGLKRKRENISGRSFPPARSMKR